MVAESMILIYGDCGDRLAKETDSLPGTAPDCVGGGIAAGMGIALGALQALESQVLEAPDLEGVALRYGLFYGPGTSSDAWADQLRRRLLALPRSPRSRMSWIHVEDAASATVAAIERAPAGAVYNVVDDEPVGIPAFIDKLASVCGTRSTWPVPLRLAQLLAPYAAAVLSARVAADNVRIGEDLGWRPAFPSFRDGLRATAAPQVRT